jgi:hypothetical protein
MQVISACLCRPGHGRRYLVTLRSAPAFSGLLVTTVPARVDQYGSGAWLFS